MNLWFRLLCYIATMPWRRRLELPHDTSRLRFRVWPLDLDTSLHLNNGRYLTLMDLGRLDLMVSGGLVGTALKKGWTPIASAVEIRFRREIRLFQKFEIQSRIVAWRDDDVIIEQVFWIKTGDHASHVAARALFSGGLYDRKAKQFVDTARLMKEVGATGPSPPLTPETEAFLASIDKLREVDRKNGAPAAA